MRASLMHFAISIFLVFSVCGARMATRLSGYKASLQDHSPRQDKPCETPVDIYRPNIGFFEEFAP